MNRKKSVIAIVVVTATIAAVGAGIASSQGDPEWQKALNARSEALNAKYGLGATGERSVAGTPGRGWYEALMARSDALNRQFGLGKYARGQASTAQPEWYTALMARSEALNRVYGLGQYAKTTP